MRFRPSNRIRTGYYRYTTNTATPLYIRCRLNILLRSPRSLSGYRQVFRRSRHRAELEPRTLLRQGSREHVSEPRQRTRSSNVSLTLDLLFSFFLLFISNVSTECSMGYESKPESSRVSPIRVQRNEHTKHRKVKTAAHSIEYGRVDASREFRIRNGSTTRHADRGKALYSRIHKLPADRDDIVSGKF